MPTLFQWNLILRHGVPLAVGIVSGHLNQMEGTSIHTSQILQAVQTEDGLILKTFSGSIYHLKAEEWSPFACNEESLAPELLGLPSDFWPQCAQAREESSVKRKENLKAVGKPGTLVLHIVGTYILSAFWIDMDSRSRSAAVMKHPGMFQDSYIITDMDQNPPGRTQLDFRLFSQWNYLEPYRIPQCLKKLLVRNEGCSDIVFGCSERKILCTAGTTTPVSVNFSVPCRYQSMSVSHT